MSLCVEHFLTRRLRQYSLRLSFAAWRRRRIEPTRGATSPLRASCVCIHSGDERLVPRRQKTRTRRNVAEEEPVDRRAGRMQLRWAGTEHLASAFASRTSGAGRRFAGLHSHLARGKYVGVKSPVQSLCSFGVVRFVISFKRLIRCTTQLLFYKVQPTEHWLLKARKGANTLLPVYFEKYLPIFKILLPWDPAVWCVSKTTPSF